MKRIVSAGAVAVLVLVVAGVAAFLYATPPADDTPQANISTGIDVEHGADLLHHDTPRAPLMAQFGTNAIEGKAVAALGADTIVMAWLDETLDDCCFIVYDTNGTAKTNKITVDNNVGSSNRDQVDVCAFNSTTFAVVWIDSTDQDASFRIYNSVGTAQTGIIDADTDVGGSYAISASAFDSAMFVMAWQDAIDQDASFRIYNSVGTAQTGIIDADTAVGGFPGIGVSAFNSTAFVLGWSTDAPDNAVFRVYDNSGSPLTAQIIVDDLPIQSGADVATFNESVFVFAWYNRSSPYTISSRTYDSSGNALTGAALAATNVGGTVMWVKAAALNESAYALSWYNNTGTDADFRVYDSSGNPLTSVVHADTTATREVVAICSQDSATSTGICGDNFVVAWTHSTSNATWAAYYPNGTAWNGVCVAGESYTPPAPTTLANTMSVGWVNYTWAAGSGNVTDSYNVLHNDVWNNGSANAYKNSDVGAGNWSNITVYAWNSSGIGTLSAGSMSDQNTAPSSAPPAIPPCPANIANTTGNFWVNHTWSAGSGNVTDSYRVRQNGTWYNSTSTPHYNATSIGAHGYSDITVYAYNSSSSGTLSIGSAAQNTTLANNPITITNTSGWNGIAGANVYVDYDASDLDGDTPSFSCNRTDLFSDFSTATGIGNWIFAGSTTYVNFGASDGYGSTSNYTMALTGGSAHKPPSPVGIGHTTGNFWVNHTWSAGSGNVTDSYCVLANAVWHNNTLVPYYKGTYSAHAWQNITVYAWNSSGIGTLSD